MILLLILWSDYRIQQLKYDLYDEEEEENAGDPRTGWLWVSCDADADGTLLK